ncbi:MAG: hypothetical protein ACOC44_13055 [Promethearchaeia archaeon]
MDTLEEDLFWIEEEFQVLFENKDKKFSNNDKKTASRILDKVSRELNCAPDKETKECLRHTLRKLKSKYPDLIKE